MELVNSTPYPAQIFRTVIDQERIAASVFARLTFDIAAGSLSLSHEQSWPVSAPPWDSPYGPMDSDEVFWKGGVDVFLFGHARSIGRQVDPGSPWAHADLPRSEGVVQSVRTDWTDLSRVMALWLFVVGTSVAPGVTPL